MWAQSRIARRVVGAGHACEQVARPGAGLLGGVVLLHLESEPAQLLHHGVRHGALFAGRALDLAEPHEVGDQPLALLAGRLDDHGRHATRGRSGRNTRVMDPEVLERIHRSYVVYNDGPGVLRGGYDDFYAELFHPDAELVVPQSYPDMEPVYVGVEGLKRQRVRMDEIWEDLRWEPERFIEADPFVVVLLEPLGDGPPDARACQRRGGPCVDGQDWTGGQARGVPRPRRGVRRRRAARRVGARVKSPGRPLGVRLGVHRGLDLGRPLTGELERSPDELAEERLRAQRARLELGVVLGRDEERVSRAARSPRRAGRRARCR